MVSAVLSGNSARGCCLEDQPILVEAPAIFYLHLSLPNRPLASIIILPSTFISSKNPFLFSHQAFRLLRHHLTTLPCAFNLIVASPPHQSLLCCCLEPSKPPSGTAHSSQNNPANNTTMSYYYSSQHHPPSSTSSHSSSSHNHHGGRSRRAPRLSNSQNSHRQFRGVRSMKELTESPVVSAFRLRFEAGRSFDLDDDLEFCPGLLTEDDVSILSEDVQALRTIPVASTRSTAANTNQLHSIPSSSSDGSLSSGSPHSSPLQQQIQPSQQVTPGFSLSSASNNSYNPATGFNSNNSHHHMKIHQPSALRTRNAIPIVNPSTGMRVASPPSSISPAMMQQQTYARRW